MNGDESPVIVYETAGTPYVKGRYRIEVWDGDRWKEVRNNSRREGATREADWQARHLGTVARVRDAIA